MALLPVVVVHYIILRLIYVVVEELINRMVTWLVVTATLYITSILTCAVVEELVNRMVAWLVVTAFHTMHILTCVVVVK